VASVDCQAAGFGQIVRWGRRGEISDLIISSEWRGRGIGTALIGHLIGIARQYGVCELEIGTAHSNIDALKLYRRLGFKIKSHKILDLGRGPEAVIYLNRMLE
jgi:ribosomal protein S18 acetylase RimI-like enzyme